MMFEMRGVDDNWTHEGCGGTVRDDGVTYLCDKCEEEFTLDRLPSRIMPECVKELLEALEVHGYILPGEVDTVREYYGEGR